MLRRNSTRSSRRKHLSRSKSSSSIHHNPVEDLQLFDPIIAERDAQIAARLSYQRAYGRSMAYPQVIARASAAGGTMTPSPHLERGGNSSRLMVRSEGASSHRGALDEEQQQHRIVGGGGAGGLKHQKSIRFAGASAKPRRVLASRATEPHVSTSNSLSRLTIADSALVVPPRAQSSLSANRDRGYVLPSMMPTPHGTAAAGHRGGDSSRAGGGPSFTALREQSIRRVRKTRSMFTAQDSFDSLFQDSPGEVFKEAHLHDTRSCFRSRYAALNKDKENERQSPPTLETKSLRAPKSMGFLRNRRNHSSTQSGDFVVQMAREKFREQQQEQEEEEARSRLKSQPSTFFRSKTRRAESSLSFRKSLRNSSNTSGAALSALSGNSIIIEKEGGSLRHTARKVSQSLKSRLRGMFGRKSSDSSVMVPRDSDGECALQMNVRKEEEEEEDVSVSRGPSRMTTLQHALPCQLVESREASIASSGQAREETEETEEVPEVEESSGGDMEERSRVTSWTDSITDTGTSQCAAAEWERQRLSVIKENGMHFASPALNRTAVNRGVTHGHPSPIDSQRVYSALMKRAQEARDREDSEREQSIADIRGQGKAPVRGSSMDQLDTATTATSVTASVASPTAVATIRRVASDDGDVFRDDEADGGLTELELTRGSTPSRNKIIIPNDPQYMIPRDGHSPGWQSPGITAYHRKRGDYERTRIVDRSSAFFASPTNHFFRAQSPFRRVLQENMRTTDAHAALGGGGGGGGTSYLASLSELSLPTRKPSTVGSERKRNARDADSIYSYHEDGGDYPRRTDAEFETGGYLVDRFPKPPLSQSSTGLSSHTDKSVMTPSLGHGPGHGQGQRPDSAASSVE